MAEESKTRRFFSAIGAFLKENRAPIAATVVASMGVGATAYVINRGIHNAAREGYKLGLKSGREDCESEREQEDEE